MTLKKSSSVIAAGLALFSMFFGAGDLIWPLILGGNAGDKNFFAMLGLLITGVSLPLLGLIAMMLFKGDYREFFGQVGKWPGIVLVFIIQAILGPLGSIPRLITLSFATLKPYLPENLTLLGFSFLASFLVLGFTLRRNKVISLLGLVLTPILLLCLGSILVLGFLNHPDPSTVNWTSGEAFNNGLHVGYNTLDLIAAFIFAPLVLSHFMTEKEDMNSTDGRQEVFGKMLKASLLAAGLLSAMYVGLTYVASFYVTHLPADHLPEERLSAIAQYLLGPYGAFFACCAVAMACLTTAIPIVAICSDYIQQDLMPKNQGPMIPLFITLGISLVIANLGFTGIANMLSPVLNILCPSLIVLSILNIVNKMYEIRTRKTPVLVTFALSTVNYFI
jgi:LIVCS family branched-chain amino acid:cation transporter